MRRDKVGEKEKEGQEKLGSKKSYGQKWCEVGGHSLSREEQTRMAKKLEGELRPDFV